VLDIVATAAKAIEKSVLPPNISATFAVKVTFDYTLTATPL